MVLNAFHYLTYRNRRNLQCLWPALRYGIKVNKECIELILKRNICITCCNNSSHHASPQLPNTTNNFASAVSEDEKLIESLKTTFPLPSHTLKNFYYLMSQNLKKDFSCNYEFDKSGEDHSPTFVCTVRLGDPFSKSFVGHGRNKKMAEYAASLKALSCLYREKRMDTIGRPVELTQTSGKASPLRKAEIMKMLHSPVRISVPQDFISEAEDLISTFDREVAPVIMSSSEPNDLELEQEETESMPRTVNLMTGRNLRLAPETNETRNSKMFHQLAKRREKISPHSYTIDQHQEEILEALSQNSVVIIEGGTGCGKSTQVPQMILEEWIERGRGSDCNVVVGQPRRIATLALAHWVASERGEKVGSSVGYKMRLEARLLREQGGIVFYTSGSLREVLRLNPRLEGVSHVLIDEVHERSIDTDLLLLMLKRALEEDPHFKLVLMSATARVEELKRYFETDCVISVDRGKTFPVAIRYIDEMEPVLGGGVAVRGGRREPSVDHKVVLELIRLIDETRPQGAVLVFLPGWNDIKVLESALASNPRLWVLPLHSRLPRHAQNRIFAPCDDGCRKVILATNVAETSLTIEDVVYVVDSGLQNDSRYVPRRNVNSFGTCLITKANAIQRAGRAGRVRPGEVFRLYSAAEYDAMEEFPLPEMAKLPLQTVVLRCKSLFEDVPLHRLLNELIEPPSPLAVASAIETLTHLRVMRPHQGQGQEETESLTALGRTLARLSTSPSLGKALVYSAFFRCVDTTINFVSLENNMTGIFKHPPTNSALRAFKAPFSRTSDHVAMCRFLRQALTGDEEDIDLGALDSEEMFDSPLVERRDRLFEDRQLVESTLCPDRMSNFEKVKNLFQRQLKECLPSLFVAESNGSSSELLVRSPDAAFDTDFPLEGVGERETPSTEAALIVACFLSSVSSIIRRVSSKGQKEEGLFSLVAEDGAKVRIHKSSVLSDCDLKQLQHSNFFFSTDTFYSQTRNVSIAKEISAAAPLSVALFYGEDLELFPGGNSEKDSNYLLRIKGRDLAFHVDKRTGECLLGLRRTWQSVFEQFVRDRRLDTSSNTDSDQVAFEFAFRLNQCIKRILN